MIEEEVVETDEQLPLESVADKLRRSREEQGRSLSELAERTRIAQRHLELIERGEFSELPGRTYAFGFTRTYARELGLDDDRLVRELREQLSDSGSDRPAYQPGFEPGDPAKVPPIGIVMASAIAVLLLAIGIYAFYGRFMSPGADPQPEFAGTNPASTESGQGTGLSSALSAQAAADAQTSVPADQVVFTALEEGVWVSFYEAGGRRLEQKLMAQGERFVVPPQARDPRIWTGRPDAFAITVGGQPLPPLAEDEVVVRDVSITAEALRERAEDENVAPEGPTNGPTEVASAAG